LTGVLKMSTFVLILRKGNDVINSLFSKTKQKILALLFLHPEKQYYLREMVRHTGVSQGTLHRELKSLLNDGILLSERRNNQIFYSVNTSGPIYIELRGIIFKSFGVRDILKKALKPLERKIKVAFIYGSIARNEDTAGSDIDLMLIGRLTFMESTNPISEAEKILGRTVNPTIFPVDEFRQKLQSKNHFLSSVIETPLTFIIGEQIDLRELAKG